MCQPFLKQVCQHKGPIPTVELSLNSLEHSPPKSRSFASVANPILTRIRPVHYQSSSSLWLLHCGFEFHSSPRLWELHRPKPVSSSNWPFRNICQPQQHWIVAAFLLEMPWSTVAKAICSPHFEHISVFLPFVAIWPDFWCTRVPKQLSTLLQRTLYHSPVCKRHITYIPALLALTPACRDWPMPPCHGQKAACASSSASFSHVSSSQGYLRVAIQRFRNQLSVLETGLVYKRLRFVIMQRT